MSEEKKKTEKETVKTKFGEVTKTGPGAFTAGNDVLYSLLDQAGIPDAKQLMPKLAKAYTDIGARVTEEVLVPEVIQTKESAQIKLGTGNFRILASLGAEENIRNPQTGESNPVFGRPMLRVSMKYPEKMRDENGPFGKIAKDIAAAFAAKRK